MASKQCGFIWYELNTTDQAAARVFYGNLAGWSATAMPMSPPGMNYTLLSLSGGPAVAGMMDLMADARAKGVPPHWLGYVGVDDVDASQARALALGASVVVPATDIPGVGRFAYIQDPQGAALVMMTSINPAEAPPPPAAGTPGTFGWHELYSTDWPAALAFYDAMFGWQKGEAMDMGPMGTYQMFTCDSVPIGGMMTKPAAMPVPAWGYYINVAGVDAALATITAGGGMVLSGPHQVPGGNWIIQGMDPQGAAFAVVGPQR